MKIATAVKTMEDSTSVSTSKATAEVCEFLIKHCLFYVIQITEKRVAKMLRVSHELSRLVLQQPLMFLRWHPGIFLNQEIILI